MTDTNCGIMKNEAEQHGIYVIPMPVIIEEKTYYEGKDIDAPTFFEAQCSGKAVSTSQPSPADVMDAWDNVLNMGYDEIIYIPMSSGLSHSCETALTLSQEYEGKVFVADNHRISITQWASTLQAKQLADQGKTASQIKEYLEKTAYDASIYIAVDTLEYLKKGGRVTPAGAALGSILHIKPILSIQGDKLDAFAKVRGLKKALPLMVRSLKHDIETRYDGDESCLEVATAGAGLTESEIQSYVSVVQEAFPNQKVRYYPLPLSVCVHTGRGAIGTGFYRVKI